MRDTVSIVMPAYNAETTIRCAIDSVLAQTYPHWELVIVDDASTDNTAEIARSYEDQRIHLYSNTQNSGEGATRDVAIANSTGEWVAVLDADDAWLPQRLEKMLTLEPKITGRTLLVDNLMQCYEKSGELVPWQALWPEHSGLMTASELCLAEYLEQPRFIVTPLFPREAIVDHGLRHSTLKFSADSEFIIRLMKRAGLRMKVFPEPMYLYRLTPGSASAVRERYRIARGMLAGLQEELDFDEDETAAIEGRKALLKRQDEYMKLLVALKEKRYLKAVGLAMSRPGRLLELLRRVPQTMRYRTELWRQEGSGR